MSDNTQSVVIDPRAAASEYAALNDHYRNRNLILANENVALRTQIDALQAELQANKEGVAAPSIGEEV